MKKTEITIKDLIKKNQMFLEKKELAPEIYGHFSSNPLTYLRAIETIGINGVVATMPLIIAGKAKSNTNNDFWKEPILTNSSECVIPDKKGIIGNPGNNIYICEHGINRTLSFDRCNHLFSHNDRPNFDKYTNKEILDILEGRLPNGEKIEHYHVSEVKKGKIPNPLTGKYQIWMNYSQACQFDSGSYNRVTFKDNLVVHARSGTLEYLDEYFDKAVQYSHNKRVDFNNTIGTLSYFEKEACSLIVGPTHQTLLSLKTLNNNYRIVGVTLE